MKFLIITKKHLIMAGCVLMAVIIGTVISINAFARQEKLLPIYCVETEEKRIALTFDAAWGADDTDTLIAVLQKYNATATFFVVGEWVDKYPNEVKKLSDAGFDVMNHSATHPYMTKLSEAAMKEQLKICNDKIAAVTGKTPTLFRCPYGDYDNKVIATVESVGMKTLQWDVDSLDWKDTATVESIVTRVTGKVKNGSIVLFHNDADHTPEALPIILEKLTADGYTFVKAADLIYQDNYTIKHDGTQCKKIESTN